MASIFEMSFLGLKPFYEYKPKSIQETLRRDWDRVGQDMKNAVERYKSQLK